MIFVQWYIESLVISFFLYILSSRNFKIFTDLNVEIFPFYFFVDGDDKPDLVAEQMWGDILERAHSTPHLDRQDTFFFLFHRQKCFQKPNLKER